MFGPLLSAVQVSKRRKPLRVISDGLIPRVLRVVEDPPSFLLKHFVRRYDTRRHLSLGIMAQMEGKNLREGA